MNIPKTLRVGYQERKDTFTGKLAYVIYIDEKGVVRKERSWTGWCDKKQGVNDYPNVPTSGFVMNKKVGDYKSDWNHRQAAIRIYDPRGFEFEIGVENLLYILEECSSIKGKGLEGEFVYAWEGSDLVLLPVSSQEYQTSLKFTEAKSMKVGKKDMVEGCVYMNKDMETVMYLGKHDVFEFSHAYGSDYSNGVYSHKLTGKQHVFVYTEHKETVEYYENQGKDSNYWFQGGFTKIASKVSDIIATNFAEEYDKFKKSLCGSQCKTVVIKEKSISKTELSKSNYYGSNRLMKHGEDYIKVDIRKGYEDNNKFVVTKGSYIAAKGETVVEVSMRDNSVHYSNWNTPRPKEVNYTLEQITEMEFYTINLVNDSGKMIPII
jgi:hypothetical protein